MTIIDLLLPCASTRFNTYSLLVTSHSRSIQNYFCVRHKSRRKDSQQSRYRQQNYNKTLLAINLVSGADQESYISECLMLIKASNDHKYNMLANKSSKFLFHHFNDFLS